MSVVTQLPLRLALREGSTFANFQPGRNQELLDTLARVRSAVAFRVLFVWGEGGTGKTHLLEAACHANGEAAVYVPLKLAADLSPAMLEGLESHRVVCVDDVQAVAGRADWEAALFRLYERLPPGAVLLATASAAPRHLGLGLRDLATRLAAGVVYHVHPLQDEEKRAVLIARARVRGLELTEEAAGYLLARHPRDMHALMALLERIDEAALAQQRSLTIPFLRRFE